VKLKPYATAGFTVVELLVVIGIVVLLLVAAIPAVNSLSKSGGRKAAVSNLVNGIDQARNQALRDQLNTYFVVPTFPSSSNTATVSAYNSKSFAIFEDDPSSVNSSGVVTAVKQLTKWTTLPTGIAIRSGSVGFLVDLSTLITAPIFGPDKSSAPTFRCIQFNSNGEVVQPTAGTSSSFDLNIFEGFVSAGGGETFTSAKSSNNPTATETVRVQRYTGRAESIQ
jgi:Tfp pilus assembly protein FimT